MCASNSPCRSSPRPESPSKTDSDYVGYSQQQPLHHPPPPYVYYPPPYPPFNPYNPYAPYHPRTFYTSPYCNEAAQESKGFPWIGIFLVFLLLLGIVSVIFYRTLSRDARRRITPRLPTLAQPAQPTRRKRDAKQNYPAEFILSDVANTPNRDYNTVFCQGCDPEQGSMKPGTFSVCERDENRKDGIDARCYEFKTTRS